MDYKRVVNIVYGALNEINSYHVNKGTSHLYLALEKLDVITKTLEKEINNKGG